MSANMGGAIRGHQLSSPNARPVITRRAEGAASSGRHDLGPAESHESAGCPNELRTRWLARGLAMAGLAMIPDPAGINAGTTWGFTGRDRRSLAAPQPHPDHSTLEARTRSVPR